MDKLERRFGDRLALAFEVKDLACDQPAAPRGARQLPDQGGHPVPRRCLRLGENFKSDGQERVAREDSDAFAKNFVTCGAPAAQVVVVHAGEVVMNEGIGVDAFHGAGGGEGVFGKAAAEFRGREGEGGAQALAPCKKAISHRLVDGGRLGRCLW